MCILWFSRYFWKTCYNGSNTCWGKKTLEVFGWAPTAAWLNWQGPKVAQDYLSTFPQQLGHRSRWRKQQDNPYRTGMNTAILLGRKPNPFSYRGKHASKLPAQNISLRSYGSKLTQKLHGKVPHKEHLNKLTPYPVNTWQPTQTIIQAYNKGEGQWGCPTHWP